MAVWSPLLEVGPIGETAEVAGQERVPRSQGAGPMLGVGVDAGGRLPPTPVISNPSFMQVLVGMEPVGAADRPRVHGPCAARTCRSVR